MEAVQVGAWMLVLITAKGPFDYSVVPLFDAPDADQCHFHAYLIDADIQREDNQELLCIQVSGHVASVNWPGE